MSHQLPVLDISTPDELVAKRLVDTVAKYGFVYIKNHGLSLPGLDIDDMFALVHCPG
jgi:isopenicillin N synthase-like dioxygenase